MALTEQLDFTKEQLSEVICKHAERENGLHELMEIMIESMMLAERREYLREDSVSGNKGNGFRPGHTYGQGRALTFVTSNFESTYFSKGKSTDFGIVKSTPC